jgi:hypothetical protein
MPLHLFGSLKGTVFIITPTFTAEAAKVTFPRGGIGTGTVSLGASGDLRDWKIFNRPAIVGLFVVRKCV